MQYGCSFRKGNQEFRTIKDDSSQQQQLFLYHLKSTRRLLKIRSRLSPFDFTSVFLCLVSYLRLSLSQWRFNLSLIASKISSISIAMKPTKFPSQTYVDCSIVSHSNITMTKRYPSSTCFSLPESADSESLVKKKPKLSCPSEIRSDLKEGTDRVEVEVKGKDSDGFEASVSKEADEKREGAEKKPVFDFDLNMKPVELGHGIVDDVIVIDLDGDDRWYGETDRAKEEKGTSLRGERKRYAREEKEKAKVDDDDDDGRGWLRLGSGSLSSLTNKRMRYTKEEKGKGKVDDDDDDHNVWLSLGMGLVSLDAALTSGSIDLNGSNSDGES